MTAIHVPTLPQKHYHCNKQRPVFRVDGVPYCPTCGRRVRERWVIPPNKTRPEYKRAHVGLWSSAGGC